MIKSFGDPDVEALFQGERVRRWINIEKAVIRKLAAIHDARTLGDLREPPANRLKPLSGTRHGQHSIRINDQFRVCFIWRDGHAHEVTVIDYH